MGDDLELVVVARAKTPQMASLVIQILQSEGIPAYVDGCLFQDVFGLPPGFLGKACSDIQVPEAHAKEARNILEGMKEAGEQMKAEEGDSEE